jgi:hypothetical protein
MFVNNEVVNRPLFAFTPVDPLFWILSRFDPPTSSGRAAAATAAGAPPLRWQPVDQILAALRLGLPRSVVQGLLRSSSPEGAAGGGGGGGGRWCQLDHLFARMEMGDSGDDETFHKFCPQRALDWLRRKQEAVHEVLLRLERENRLRRRGPADGDDAAAGGDGRSSSVFVRMGDGEGGAVAAFDSSFCFSGTENGRDAEGTAPPDADATGASVPDPIPPPDGEEAFALDEATTRRIQDESVQIVCNYLSNPWRDALLKSLELTRTNLEGAPRPSPKTLAGSNGTTARLAPPRLSIEMQLLGATAATPAGDGKAENRQHPAPSSQPPNKKSKIKPSDTRGMKKLTSFFSKK